MRALLSLLIVATLLCHTAANSACVHKLGGFVRVTDAPTAVTEASCTHADNKLFVMMGLTAFNTTTGVLPPSGQSFALDLNTGVWSQVADAPFQGADAATANNGTHIFIAGGFQGTAPGTPTANASVYSIADNKWSSLAALPVASGAGALAYFNGELFYFGGLTDADTATNASYSLNLSAPNATWAALPAQLPDPRAHAVALLLATQSSPLVLLPGGAVGNASAPIDLNSTVGFDPLTLLFNSSVASMPSNRSHYGADVANASGCCPTRGLLFGGRDLTVPRVLDTVIEYAPDENVWTPVGNLPHQWFSPCGAFHVNATGSFLFVAVGGLDFFLPTNETQVAPVATICNAATTPFVTPGPTASLPITAPPLPTPGPTTSATSSGSTTGGAASTSSAPPASTVSSSTGTTTGATATPSPAPSNTTAPPNGTTTGNATTAPPPTNGTTTTAPPPTNGTTTTAPPPTNGTTTTAPPPTTATTAPPPTTTHPATTAPPPTTATTAPPPSPTTKSPTTKSPTTKSPSTKLPSTTIPTSTTAPPSPPTTAPPA